MCDDVSRAALPQLSTSRRGLLGATVASAATFGGFAAGRAAAAAPGRPSGDDGPTHRTRLVLLGTAGGPALLDGVRAGISTAVVYEDRVYVVDLGPGSMLRLVQSALGGGSALPDALATLQGVFFTHLHSDHFADWPSAYAIGQPNSFNRHLPPVHVFGPGDRGSLPRVFPPGRPTPATHHPEDPTPGIAGMTAYLDRAFAQDINDRLRDSNNARPDQLFHVHDIDLAGVWDVAPEGRPPRLTVPLPIWVDGDVQITATLVDHHPTAPAFAFRFDTPDGSVVVSGDTTVSENLIDLARDCDYLVHEVIDSRYVEEVTAAMPPEIGEPAREHLLSAHTTIEQVGRDVAEPAGARNLVLTHLVPSDNARGRWRQAQRGYSGRVIVGEDLLQLGVGRRRR